MTKKTPLFDIHTSLGAKMAEFAGYHMPISYTSISDEHEAVRNNVGVFDVSHMGEFFVSGEGALELLQKITSNDVSKLAPGQAQYSCFPNMEGGIVDDLIVYNFPGNDAYMLVVNASNIEKDWEWVNNNNTFGAKVENVSDGHGLLAIQGPNAKKVLQPLTKVDLNAIEFYHFAVGEFAGIENAIISATGYTGSGGFEIYVPEDRLVQLWNAIFENSEETGIKPAGLGARDTLRLEMGYCLYGNDIDGGTSPLEAGLGWITKLAKGSFNSSDIFNKQKEEGVKRRLVGFKVLDRRVPRQGYKIKSMDGEILGEVTSGTQSPSLDIPIGMGYVRRPHTKSGNKILIDTGKKSLEAEIVKLPFYKVDK